MFIAILKGCINENLGLYLLLKVMKFGIGKYVEMLRKIIKLLLFLNLDKI